MNAAPRLPVEVEELTAGWFTDVLQREVSEATVLDRSSGTTGRARVSLRGESGLPPSVFVKLPPFDHEQRQLVDASGMGVAEARFYRDLAGEVPVQVPAALYAETDGERYVMVLEDLSLRNCRVPGPDDPDLEARIRDIVEQLATLHAAYWESKRFGPGGDLEWLVPRRVRAPRHLGELAMDRLGDQLDEPFRRVGSYFLAHYEDILRLWHQGPATLVHGDCHLGNLFVDPAQEARTGFLDWAVVNRSQGVRDVAYVICQWLPPEARERLERELVEHYCQLVTTAGVDIDPHATWDQYRRWAVYAWYAAATTSAMGSKWQAIDFSMEALARTTTACEQLDSIGLLESLIG